MAASKVIQQLVYNEEQPVVRELLRELAHHLLHRLYGVADLLHGLGSPRDPHIRQMRRELA